MKPFKFLQRKLNLRKEYDQFILKDMCNRNLYMQVAWSEYPRNREDEESHYRKYFEGDILQFYATLKFRSEGMITPTIYEMSVVRRGWARELWVFGNQNRRTNKFISRNCKLRIVYDESL